MINLHKKHIENFRKYLAALRSGDFKQGKGHLKLKDCYCALGVSCEIQNLPTNDDGFCLYGITYSWLPPEEWFIKTYGVSVDDLKILSPNEMSIFRANDSKGFGFKRIANGLEKWLLKNTNFTA